MAKFNVTSNGYTKSFQLPAFTEINFATIDGVAVDVEEVGNNAVLAKAGNNGQTIVIDYQSATNNIDTPTYGATNIYTQYRRSIAAFSKVRNGTGNARIFFHGDSTTTGTGSVSVGSTTIAQTKAPTQHLANIINKSGLKATTNCFCGDNNLGSPASFTGYDTRWTHSGAASWFGAKAPSGNAFRLNATGNSITFTASENCNQWDIYYYDGSGTFSWTGSGGGTGNVVLAGTNIVKKATVSVTSGASLTVANVSGVIYIQGMAGSLTTAPELQVFNGGAAGNTAGNLATDMTLTTYAAFAFDLVVVEAGLNDIATSVPVATYKASLQAIVTAHKASGSDVIISTFNPRATSLNSIASQLLYVQAVHEVAIENNILELNVFDMLGSYEVANPLGYYSDTVHLSGLGYAAKAKYFANLISTF